jgi:subtilase family protein
VIKGAALLLVTVALVLPVAASGFTPTDPLASKQWYLNQIHAFDFWPDAPPVLAPVRVAVVDSGIDTEHPEFAGKIAATQSFVGGDVTDHQGHGTFVAGIIAAASGNGQGISGIALSAQLLVAKVVRSDGTISPGAEAKAIRWAVNNGARVINLSLGGLRSRNRNEDTYSAVEQDAIEYAYAKGAVLVAAVGNGDQAPRTPWDLASYPAALPHVIGVSALAQDGSVPAFSNRDAFFNDIAAPGVNVVSTLPRVLTAARPTCAEQGYSVCGPPEFRSAEGTSYAAAEVSAAAALLIAERPSLTPEQVSTLLERSADDVNAASGCRRCPLLRDPYSGWGQLDITAALRAIAGPIPPADHYESNDDAGARAFTLWGRRSIDVTATLDFWDDQIDVYKVRLHKGQTISVSLHGPAGLDPNLVLWRPGTQKVEGLSPDLQSRRLTQSVHTGSSDEHFLHRARQDGWYYVEVKLPSAGSGQYHLHIAKSR